MNATPPAMTEGRRHSGMGIPLLAASLRWYQGCCARTTTPAMSSPMIMPKKQRPELLDLKPSVTIDQGMKRLAQHYKDNPRPERNTGSVAAERVMEVADDQRVRAESAADAAGSGRSDTMNDLQSVRAE